MIEELKLHIDKVGFKDKESVKQNVGAIKNRVQNSKPIRINVDEFVKAIEEGKTFSPAIMKGTKRSDFEEQQIFAIDIDNNNEDLPILQIQDAIDICNQNYLPLAFYYPSFSHTESKPKYRLIFILDKAITNRNERNLIMNNLCSLFGQADKSCVNEDRIFYGTNKKVVKCNIITPVKSEDILKLLPPKADNEFSNQDTPKNYDNELDNLKQEFDFCNYLAERNGGIKSDNGNCVTFYQCEVCGHNEDLAYYRDTNTFKCFGANGGQSGSIIKYLMITENLTTKEAIDKFKYELCGIEKANTINSYTLEELFAMDLKEPYFIVENLLCQGLNILAGPPKIGKSWLCLDLCNSICNGEKFLGFNTNQAECLYLCLEDSYNRVVKRAKSMLHSKDIPKGFHLSKECASLNNGLIEGLQDFLKKYPKVKLIIIDTLQKIRGCPIKTELAYGYDYREMGKLKAFADNNEICILVIHHLRKQKDPDIFNQISGSTGLTGVADTEIVLAKADIQKDEILIAVTGRDVESMQKLATFDNRVTFKWSIINDFDDFASNLERLEYDTNPIVITIHKLLEENPEGFEISAEDLLKEIYRVTESYPRQRDKNALTRHISDKLQFDLLQFDGIHYEKPNKNGGSAGRKMYFTKPKKDTNI